MTHSATPERSVLAALDRALRLDPDNAELQRQRAEHVRQFGDVRDEIEELEARLDELETKMLTSKDGALLKEHEKLTELLLRARKN